MSWLRVACDRSGAVVRGLWAVSVMGVPGERAGGASVFLPVWGGRGVWAAARMGGG
jgi:hypothetical protein